ncbi:MAG TPA: DUF2752 domain-containing protein [Planctomycetes bacterium]|nr:DUF2752 domain-containing protein [Planctomycetota bacterium]
MFHRVTFPNDSPRLRSLITLILLVGVLVLSLVLDVDAKSARLGALTGPTCLVGQFGHEIMCPGCGLTRSTSLAMQGEWWLSWSVHPTGVLIAFLCFSGCIVHIDILRGGHRSGFHEQLLRWGRYSCSIGILIGWWLRITLSG